MLNLGLTLTLASILIGLCSAASWFYAGFVKVDHEKAVEDRLRKARKKGEEPNYASVSLDGWDMSATFSAQSKWNSLGALFAACSILLQAVAQVVSY
ncbi:hypothetical protein [Pseudomonas sp. R76]|uniref:hypothetical protein n=1 Tax=Pseudomonas sp. R76 TaxID=1573711 RepID=UPI00135ACD28|nr:hypothetical protein [Pseudomonas sp. R76]